MRLLGLFLLAQLSVPADEMGQALTPAFTGAFVPSGRPVEKLGQNLPGTLTQGEAHAPVPLPGSGQATTYRSTGAGHWVDVIATAYSPEDPLDGAYRATKGRWRYITADGSTDVREQPYGVAVPKVSGRPLWAYGTRVVIPAGLGYVEHMHPDRTFTIDDTGSALTRMTSQTGDVHVDLRFRSSASARAWAGPTGHRRIRMWIVE